MKILNTSIFQYAIFDYKSKLFKYHVRVYDNHLAKNK